MEQFSLHSQKKKFTENSHSLCTAKVKFAPFSSKGFGVYDRLEKGANLTPALYTAEKVNI